MHELQTTPVWPCLHREGDDLENWLGPLAEGGGGVAANDALFPLKVLFSSPRQRLLRQL